MTEATASIASATVLPSAVVDGLERLGVGGLGLLGGGDDLVGELDEALGLGDEVGLGVELDERAPGVGDQPGRRGALGAALGGLGRALDAQHLDGLVEVAVGLLEGLLGVHHPGAGGVAELLHICGGDGHALSVPRFVSVLGWCVRGAVARGRRVDGARSATSAAASAADVGVGVSGLRRAGSAAARQPPRRRQQRGPRQRRLDRSLSGGLGGGSLGGRSLGGGASAAGLGSRCLDSRRLGSGCLGGRRLGSSVGRRRGDGGLGRRVGRRPRASSPCRSSSSRSHSASGSSAPSSSPAASLPVLTPARAIRPSATASAIDAGQQGDGADRVVVARDRVVDDVGVAVAVEDRDDRDAELARLVDGEVLLVGVDDPDRGRNAAHVADAAEGALELVVLAPHLEELLLRAAGAGHVVEVDLLELLEALDAAGARSGSW